MKQLILETSIFTTIKELSDSSIKAAKTIFYCDDSCVNTKSNRPEQSLHIHSINAVPDGSGDARWSTSLKIQNLPSVDPLQEVNVILSIKVN